MADLHIRALQELAEAPGYEARSNRCAVEAAHIEHRAVRLWGKDWRLADVPAEAPASKPTVLLTGRGQRETF